MDNLEPKKDDLGGLSGERLEELIARLCEAEISARGGKLRDVMWSGSIKASDGGVDVRVVSSSDDFEGDFIPRSDTVFQAKAKSMPRAEILEEMGESGKPSAIVVELAANNGAYIIASTEDCSPLTYSRRIEAMREAVASFPKAATLQLEFYDRSRLHRWLRQYPSVQVWLRNVLGQPLTGWRSFGRWSATPPDADDTLILKEGVTVDVPSAGSNNLSLEEALPVARNLISTSGKPIRITGLSGVGKTRFVQALFEEDVGDGSLDRTSVIYADIGDQPDPSAHSMIDTLLAQNSSLTVVLDNCASDLHNSLAARLRAKANSLRLITVEYDIREDKPQTTEVIQIEAHGPNIAETLLLRRYPNLGQLNAAKIAEFSEGNARLALAIAESAPIDDNLSKLTDDQLFNRLFYQRHDLDSGLKEQAEALSLVYSFSIDSDEEGIDELGLLGELCEHTRLRMHRATQTLVERQVAQQRSRWRAVLPHAVANRLAAEALSKIPVDLLTDLFERRAGARLLKSFGRRLGFLHEHPVAIEIVNRWVSEGGILSDLLELNEHGRELFLHIAPVAPERTLELIERTLTGTEILADFKPRDSFRSVALNLLVGLAYYPEHFDRAVEVLLKVAENEDPDNNYDSVRGKLDGLFQLYLSGTHADLEQRVSVVETCLRTSSSARQSLGLKLLDSALEAGRWTGLNTFEFGARPRDYGYNPNFGERLEWLKRFLGVAVNAAASGTPDLVNSIRRVVADNFRGLWRYPDLRSLLIEHATKLNSISPWPEGWRAVRSVLYFDYRKPVDDPNHTIAKAQLELLEQSLSPQDLLSEIEALVINAGHDIWSIDDEFEHDNPSKYEEARQRLEARAFGFGETVGKAPDLLENLINRLFEGNHAPYRTAFGRGLISGSTQPRETWSALVDALRALNTKSFNYSVLSGALDELSKLDAPMTAKILDAAASDELLRPIIVGLHPYTGFSNSDFDRCLSVLGDLKGYPHEYEILLWRDGFQHIEYEKLFRLAELMLGKEGGDFAVLEAMTMRLHGKPKDEDVLGEDLRKLAMRAASSHLTKDDPQSGGMGDYRLTEVLRHCLPYEGCEEEKAMVLDSLFDVQNGAVRHLYRYDDAVAEVVKHLTGPFLTRALLDCDAQDYLRFRAFESGSHFKNPLEGVSSQELADWCRVSGGEESWALIANAIAPFGPSKDGGTEKLTEQALCILKNAPDPVEVLKVYIDAVEPMSWSGSRADIMARRIAALASLDSSHVNSLKAHLASALPRLRKTEGEEREREANRDRDSEQRFE